MAAHDTSPHALAAVATPPPLTPAACPTEVISLGDGDAAPAWKTHRGAVCSRAWLLGPPPAPQPGTPVVAQVYDAAFMSSLRCDLPSGQWTDVCDSEALLTHARQARARHDAITANLRTARRVMPNSRLVLLARLETGHTAAISVRGMRPGFWIEGVDPRALRHPRELMAALCAAVGVAAGTFTCQEHRRTRLRDIRPGDVVPGALPGGAVQRVRHAWLWVTAPEPGIVKQAVQLLRKFNHVLRIRVGSGEIKCRLPTAETRVDPAFQAMLNLGIDYEGFVAISDARVRTGARREWHTDLELQCDAKNITAWQSSDAAPDAYAHVPAAFPTLVAGFDIEARSSRGSATRDVFPDATVPEDRAFVTCLSFMWAHAAPRVSDAVAAACPNVRSTDTIFLRLAVCATARAPEPIPGAVVLHTTSERAALNAVRDILTVIHRPQIIMGYYSARFDVPYLSKRAEVVGAARFAYMSAHMATRTACETMQISSQQMGAVELSFWGQPSVYAQTASGGGTKRDRGGDQDAQRYVPPMRAAAGLLCLDLYWWIKNRYSLNKYGLNDAVAKFLPAEPHAKFDMPYNLLYAASEGSAQDVAKVTAYCCRDTDLVLLVAGAIAVAGELAESCRIMAVSPHVFLQQKQSVRLFHQLLREARRLDYVLNDVEPLPPAPYKGGAVQAPVRGLYHEPVLVFDYASMYPSIMKLRNLCCSTFIPALRQPPPPDEMAQTPANIARLAHVMGAPHDLAEQWYGSVLVPVSAARTSRVLRVSAAVAEALQPLAIRIEPAKWVVFAQGVESVMKPLLITLGDARKAAKRQLAAAKRGMALQSNLAAAWGAPAVPETAEAWRAKSRVAGHADIAAAWDAPADAAAVAAARAAEAEHRRAKIASDARQKAIKVVMNSVYGGCGAQKATTFSCPQLSRATTAIGRHMIGLAARCAREEYHCKLVYGDTDSIMVTLPPSAYAACTTSQARVRVAFEAGGPIEKRLSDVSGMLIELEAVAAAALFTDRKKRYVMRIFETLAEFNANPEGGSMKLRGNDAVRRSAPACIRGLTAKVFTTLLAVSEPRAVDDALRTFEAALKPLAAREASLEDLVTTGEIKGHYGDTNAVPAALAVTWAHSRRKKGFEPVSGDRVGFVFVKQPDMSRVVPPPEIAAARYETLVMGLPEPTNPAIINAVRNHRASPVIDDDAGTSQQLTLRFAPLPAASGAGDAGAARTADAPPDVVAAAVAAMQEAAAKQGLPFNPKKIRGLWPHGADCVSARARAPEEIGDKRREVAWDEYIEKALKAVFAAFDNAVPPGTALTLPSGPATAADVADEDRFLKQRNKYTKRMTDIVGKVVPPPPGTPKPALAARDIALAALRRATGQLSLFDLMG